jgi:hypothetical protein
MTRYRRRSIVAAHLGPHDLRTLGEAWMTLDDLGTVIRSDPWCLWALAWRHPVQAWHLVHLWGHTRLLETSVLLLRRAPGRGRGRHGAPHA